MADQSNPNYNLSGQVQQPGGYPGLNQQFMDPNLQLGLSAQAPPSYLNHAAGVPSSAHGHHSQALLPHQAQQLNLFWNAQVHDIQTGELEFKVHQLPLARIKKVMKTDEDVKMISAEAPIIFAKACEIMIHELTLRAWMHAEENKRRTLQRSDIASAITKTDMFDFLIDIVPREETVRATPTKSSDKPDFHSNLPHTNPHYSYMTTQFPQGHQYATADQSQIPPAGQSGLPQQQLMQMQYLRNQLMQQPPTPSGVNPGQSPIQGSQPGMLQGQGAQGFYSQPYATYQGQQGVAGSQPLMSPQHQRGGQQHYGNPPHQ